MSINLQQISAQNSGDNWQAIVKWVENSLGEDRSYIANDVLTACLAGQIHLWIIYNDKVPTGFLTTSIIQNPQGKICYCPWLGGENLSEWVAEGFEQLKDYCRENNCLSVSWMGRDAWQKLVNVDSRQSFYSINL